MKTKHLRNLNWGLEITDIDLSTAMSPQIAEIGQLALENLVVVLPGQSIKPRQQVDIVSDIGDVELMPQSIWHRCPKDSEGVIRGVQRVTGKKDSHGKPMGLFGHDKDLDWHANRASAYEDRKDLVWLYGVHGTKGSRTSWLNMEQAYDDLSEEWKRELEGKKGIFGYEPDRYSSFDEFTSHRGSKGIPLVYTNPITRKRGLYFPYLQLFGIEGLTEGQYLNFVSELKKRVLNEKYMYHHDWNDGDVVISDQWLTIHKRHMCDMSERLLYRISMDYKKVVSNQRTFSSTHRHS